MCGIDSPWEVGCHLIAGLDNAFILGYPYLIMAFLGWGAGSTLFILFGLLSFYCNCCLSRLHTLGGHRNIRFRDLAGAVFGNALSRLSCVLVLHKHHVANQLVGVHQWHFARVSTVVGSHMAHVKMLLTLKQLCCGELAACCLQGLDFLPCPKKMHI